MINCIDNLINCMINRYFDNLSLIDVLLLAIDIVAYGR